MEHLRRFRLAEDPFRSDPVEKFDSQLASQSQALARLDRSVRQGKGLVLLVGGVGAGKSRVARRLYEELEEELFEASMMLVLRPQPDPDWLLHRFARQLGVEEPTSEHEVVIGQIYERLAIIHEDGRRAVLIVDDAHGLASAATLAEVCGLVKLEYEERRLLTVVLAGAPDLDASVLADPQLAHHVDVKVHLAALDAEEVAAYLGTRIRAAGGNPEVLLPGAVAALHELSQGAPGRLNVLADNALYEAHLADRAQVTRNDVERACVDLGWGEVGRRGWGARADDLGHTERLALAEQSRMATASDGEATVRGIAPPVIAQSAAVDLEIDDLGTPPKESDEVDDLFTELLDD